MLRKKSASVTKIGTILESLNYGKFKIIEYENYTKVTIEFLLTGTVKTVNMLQVRQRSVKDPFYPSIYGVGYIGLGKYVSKTKGKSTNEYNKWVNILRRCYGDDVSRLTGSTCCREWHNFQIFASWLASQEGYKQGWEIDKDILGAGARMYSPSTCILVPHEINSMFVDCKENYGIVKKGNSYELTCASKYLGSFSSRALAVRAGCLSRYRRLECKLRKYKLTLPVDKILSSMEVRLRADCKTAGIEFKR